MGAEAAREQDQSDRAGFFGFEAAAHLFGIGPAAGTGIKVGQVEQGHRAARNDRIKEAFLLPICVAFASVDIGQMAEAALSVFGLLADQAFEQGDGLVMHADLAMEEREFQETGGN